MDFKTMNIYQKINWVKDQVHFIKKENLNDKLGYNAVSSSMVLAPLAKALIEAGLILISECEKLDSIGFAVKTKLGESTHYKATVSMVYTWVNVDKPEEKIVCPWKCDGVNTGAYDKAVGAAYTYSEKYFMLKFFNIATDDTDPDFRVDEDKSDKKPDNKNSKPTEKPVTTTKPVTTESKKDNILFVGKYSLPESDVQEVENELELSETEIDMVVAIIKTSKELYQSFFKAFNAGKASVERIKNLNNNYKAWEKKKANQTELDNVAKHFLNKMKTSRGNA